MNFKVTNIYIWDRGSEKGPSAYFDKFSNYCMFKETPMSSTTSFLRTENSLSIMELQWPEFLITRTF